MDRLIGSHLARTDTGSASTRDAAAARRRVLPPGLHSALLALLVVLLVVVLAGCESLRFYGQAVQGQLSILTGRQSVARVLARADTPDTLRARLRLVQEARAFAETQLGLPVGRRYESYVDLQRPYAVWSVFAAPPLSLEPVQWCYPVVGCAVYRGYFEREQAERFASEEQQRGSEVYVGGVVGYSTLGWFDDPILSSFNRLRDDELIGLIFHETAHSLVFVPGDSRFNESFATFVEEEGLRQWYRAQGDAEGLAVARKERAMRAEFTSFVLGWRAQLETIYASRDSAADKQAGKARVLAAMRQAYSTSQASFAGRYDRFINEQLNNAAFITFSTYYTWVPAFAALHRQSGSLPEFYDQVRALAALAPAARAAAIDALLAPHNATPTQAQAQAQAQDSRM